MASRPLHLAVSTWIIDEVDRTLQKPYFRQRLPQRVIDAYLHLLTEQATVVDITVPVTDVATHSEDDHILATAVSATAQFLVTGDTKLQQLENFRGVAIVSPAAFLQLLEFGSE